MEAIPRVAGVLLVAWATLAACAAADEVVPTAWEKQKPLWLVYGGAKSFVPVEGRSCPDALQVTVASKPEQVWGTQAKVPGQIPVNQGDMILISFEARVVAGASGRCRVLVKEHTEPYRASFEKELTLAAEWQQYVAAGRSHASFSAGAAQIEFRLGYQAQTVQFWARRGQAPEVPSDAPTRIEVHLKRGNPFFLCDDLKTSVGDQWARYALVGKVDRDYAPGEIEVILCFGFQPQVIEVGGIALAAFGPGTSIARLPQSPNTIT